ncbi:hypothetical protein EOD39_1746 [Acipenser ruthenus]|uniref:Uncharacterized protein n=1 Tax=Acipenser ruthenus TaxID=7906 RepID=A0A444U8C8_ACIRT|nr:hypothetical protein EOD39_1746 [Acipenser ruthenus]
MRCPPLQDFSRVPGDVHPLFLSPWFLLMNNLDTRTVPSSDVAMLYELKSLVLLQDIDHTGRIPRQFNDASRQIQLNKNKYDGRDINWIMQQSANQTETEKNFDNYATQTAQTLNMKTGENFMQRMAVFLGIMGFGMSGYSSHQLTMQKSSRPSF